MADISDTLQQEKPKDAVDCATCKGRTVIGFPGMTCPDCKGLGWSKLLTEAIIVKGKITANGFHAVWQYASVRCLITYFLLITGFLNLLKPLLSELTIYHLLYNRFTLGLPGTKRDYNEYRDDNVAIPA